MPIDVSEARFEELVGEALDSLPPDLGSHMENVYVTVADRPTREEQAGRAGLLLGLYQGVSLTNRGPLSYGGATPDRITIYRLAHMALCSSEDELRARVRTTVVHEVGHHFGLSDERLRELGWA
jgi:predicted Zn-dependent protease with MMP-like domain